MDQLWPNAKEQQTMLSGLQEIFSGQSTPRELLRDMDTDYKALVRDRCRVTATLSTAIQE
ncbi:hypothetical protein STENM327S_00215 [Streptomyces tendae]